MSLKYIYWRNDLSDKNTPKGYCFAHVHLLVGYNQGNITDFLSMARELRKTFPQAKNKDIGCGKVHKSCHVNNFSIITWNGVIKRTMPKGSPVEYKGWHQFDKEVEYYW